MTALQGRLKTCPTEIGRQLAAAAIWTAALLLATIAALFLMRRLAGAFVEPLGGFQLLGATSVLILVAALIQFATPRNRLALTVPAVASAVGLAALTLPGTAPWSVGFAWFSLVVGECAVLIVCWKRPRLKQPPAALPLPPDEPAEEPISEHLVQQLTRQRNASGGESLHTLVRVSCTAGDRLAVVHLAFCPPLAATPKLTAHALDDSGAQAKVTLAETYGARIELRLPGPASDGDSVLLEVVGQSSSRM